MQHIGSEKKVVFSIICVIIYIYYLNLSNRCNCKIIVEESYPQVVVGKKTVETVDNFKGGFIKINIGI
jgi:hypothetical protein